MLRAEGGPQLGVEALIADREELPVQEVRLCVRAAVEAGRRDGGACCDGGGGLRGEDDDVLGSERVLGVGVEPVAGGLHRRIGPDKPVSFALDGHGKPALRRLGVSDGQRLACFDPLAEDRIGSVEGIGRTLLPADSGVIVPSPWSVTVTSCR